MRIDGKHVLAATTGMLSLSACTNADGRIDLANTDPTWGDANRMTMAAQVVNPNPEYDNPIPPTSASNAVRAIDAYRAGQVEEVEGVSTSGSGSSSGGSGPN